MTTRTKQLTNTEVGALFAVRYGADVYSPLVARALRSVERNHPELVEITEPMSAPKDGAKQQPYFGAILTKAGEKVILDG